MEFKNTIFVFNPIKRYLTVISIVMCVGFFCLTATASPQLRCEFLVNPDAFNPDVKMEKLNSDYIMANDVAVTGEFIYDLNFVYRNLKISRSDFITWRSKKIVSLAEGVSGLVPSLIERGYDATGVDLIYTSENLPQNKSGNLIRDYMNAHGKNLVLSDARRTPFADGSVDILLSHMLVNNVNRARRQSILKEAMRLLNPQNGEARFYGFEATDGDWIYPFVARLCPKCTVSQFVPVMGRLTFNGRTTDVNENILVINAKTDKQSDSRSNPLPRWK